MSPTPMDEGVGAPGVSVKKQPGDPLNGSSPAGNTPQNKTSSPSTTNIRYSPITPLAPLEYLQNQRRGSITDPSLHAGPTPHSHLGTSTATASIPPSLRRPESPGTGLSASSTSHEPHIRHSFSQSRPLSPFKFGDASPQPKEGANANIRRLLRSPSTDPGGGRTPTSAAQDTDNRSTPGAMGVDENGTDQMDVDPKSNEQQRRNDPGASQRPNSARKSEEVDYNSRRQSVVAGTKRKASSDKVYPPPGNEDIDPQLVGPGVSSGMNVDSEGPAPKRRGSAIDTQRIAQLSLYDRRNSVDARLGVGGPQWWGDRRDSGSSAFSNTPVTGYTTPASAFPGDSPHGRPPGGIATFAWPVIPPLDQSAPPAMQNEPAPNMSGPPHPYDPLTIMPPVTFAPDRRMSAPASSPENLSTPASTGPTRVLRSRSRPPSRVRNVDQSVNNHAGQSASSPGAGTSTEDASSSLLQPPKESGSTPYSRSPELRVSHKLAERKRRKEMKDLFDELRDQLPADRGMKASKWEILSKAIDFIVNLKQSHQDMGREIEMLRHELESFRQGIPPPFPGGPPHPVVYGHGPPVGMPGYPPPGGPAVPPPPPHQPPHHPHGPPPPSQQQQPLSRPGSSHNVYPPGANPAPPANGAAPGAARTATPS